MRNPVLGLDLEIQAEQHWIYSELHLTVAQDEIGYDAHWPRSRDEQQPEAACLAPRLRVSIDPEHGRQGCDEDSEHTEAAEKQDEKIWSVAIRHDVVTPPKSLLLPDPRT